MPTEGPLREQDRRDHRSRIDGRHDRPPRRPDRTLLFADVRQDALDRVSEQLRGEGYPVETRLVDVADRASVAALAHEAADLGAVELVIHTAGVSPNQADPATIAAVDLAGTASS
jgi:NAD(P)-dependent dehydrogenase (short-subunit alcohol dehydrogenase family)